MKLMTHEIENALPELDSCGPTADLGNIPIICRFMAKWADLSWYAVEGRKEEDGDWTFFGCVEGTYGKETGYFTLSELQDLRGPQGEKVTRDEAYGKHSLGEVL